MGFEIDYLPVGQKTDDKSGDAIAMRFWDTSPSESFVITVDGGTRESGAALVEHIKKYYKTSNVNVAILTHPDGDHASGIRDILEQLTVANLLSFVPWEHSSEILPIVQAADSRVSATSIEKRLKDALPATVEAIDLARKGGTKVIEPFALSTPYDLTQTTQLFLLGPTRDKYISTWLPNYDCLPALPARQTGLVRGLIKMVERTMKWVAETWDKELLTDPGDDETTSENNSSMVFAIKQGTNSFLFSGDAGVPALVDALAFGRALGLPIDGYRFFHVPHHGSRHNLGPSLLNYMFGNPKPQPTEPGSVTAFISATKDDPKHPSRRLTNALNRRGVKPVATAGSSKLHHSTDYVDRGWNKADPVPFYSQVEDIEQG